MYFRNKDGRLQQLPKNITYSKRNEYLMFKKYGISFYSKESTNILKSMCKFVVHDKKIVV